MSTTKRDGSSDPDSRPDDPMAAGDDKQRLTEEEKKANHIASEQKRRQAIRSGFDRLTELVPGLDGQGRSEGIVLQRTVEYMRDALEERKDLVEKLETNGIKVSDSDKLPLSQLPNARRVRGSAPTKARGDGNQADQD